MIMMASENLTLMSFNVSGLFNERLSYVQELLDESQADVILLQELWLLHDDLDKINDLSTNYLSKAKSAIPSDKLLTGRPYGGVGILWHKSLAAQISPVPVDSDRVIAACMAHQNGSKTLIVNAYLPCDNRLAESVSYEYEKCIDVINTLLITCSYNDVIIGGDFNTDYTRKNAHAKHLQAFCSRNALKDLWNENLCYDNVTYISHDMKAKSCIDHFIMSRTICVSSFSTINDPMNPSNHLPITCKIKCQPDRIKTTSKYNDKTMNIAWHKVDNDMFSKYQEMIKMRLVEKLSIQSLTCDIVNCDSKQHFHELDLVCEYLEDVLIDSAMAIFPKSKKKKAKPYWKEKIQPLKDDSLFWHWMWTECGKPTEGVITEIYKNCKRRYHYAIRKLQRDQRELRNARMAESIAKNKSRDLWRELNKMKPRSKITPPQVDGCTDNKSVCNIFANKYQTLFNTVPSDHRIMCGIKERLQTRINEIHDMPKISLNDIQGAIKRLKTNKSDGDLGLVSDMVIRAPDTWKDFLAAMITSMYSHGYYPTVLRKATVISLVKDGSGDICSSSNYRGIALSSAINKVIDWLILTMNKNTFLTNDLQFAFKANSSTSMCTLALKEVASYYEEKGGKVFCTLLDASKAFDRLRYDKLFTILEARKLEPLTLRLLVFLYEHQMT